MNTAFSSGQRWLVANIVLAVLWPVFNVWLRICGVKITPGVFTTLIAAVLCALLLRWLYAPLLRSRPTLAGGVGFVGLVLLSVALGAVAIGFRFDSLGESVYDLHYLGSEMQAQGYPSQDLWNTSVSTNRYYTWGFVMVSAVAAWFTTAIGSTYVVALMAITLLVAINYWFVMSGSALYRLSAAFTATFPASMLSVLAVWYAADIPEHLRTYYHVRLIEHRDLATLHAWLSPVLDGVSYPVESLPHVVFVLGDLHPPVFSFYLLSVLLLWFQASKTSANRWLDSTPVVLGLLSYFVNAWIAPVFVVLGAALLCLRLGWRAALMQAVIATLGAALLLSPLLWNVAAPTGAISVHWFAPNPDFNWFKWQVIWAPQLLAVLALLVLRERVPPVAIFFMLVVVSLEFIHLDDYNAGAFERFNGVLKWGSFALTGLTAALLMEETRRGWVRLVCLALFMVPSVMQMAAYAPQSFAGLRQHPNWQLDNTRWVEGATRQQLIRQLQAEAPGSVLEYAPGRAYTQVGSIPGVLGWPSLSPWPDHLSQIGSWSAADEARYQSLQAWFTATTAQPDALNGVDFVIVSADLNWSAERLAAKKVELVNRYEYVAATEMPGATAVGYFRRIRR